MLKTSSILGIIAGIASIFLWLVLNFFNPYSDSMEFGPMVSTFIMLFLPACLAIVSSLTSKKNFMLVAFLWSFPISLYLALTPGIFALFGVTSVLYLVSFNGMWLVRKRGLR